MPVDLRAQVIFDAEQRHAVAGDEVSRKTRLRHRIRKEPLYYSRRFVCA
jgi:hypothetical protein